MRGVCYGRLVSPVRWLVRSFEDLNLMLVGRALVLSSLVGVVAGAGAIAFQVLTRFAQHELLDRLAGYRPEGPTGDYVLFAPTDTPFRPLLLPLLAALGGLLAGLLIYRFAPEAAGHGTDAAVEAFHRNEGRIRGRVPIVKTIASALTLGSGGREGPIAQIGAGFGSFLATQLGFSDRDRRVLLAAGVGAGVGSIFRAPLAGALFAAEILYSDPEFESEVVIPAAIACIVAYCVFSLKFGFGALFSTPRFDFHSPAELIPYTVLAVVVALAAGLFVTVFYRTHEVFERLRTPKWFKPVIGGFGTGLVGLALLLTLRDERALAVLAFGYGAIQDALVGSLSIPLLLAIAFGKMLTTSLSISSGGSAGVFGPSMVIGGCLGGVVGLLAQRVMPEVVTQPGAFVIVGMAGFFAAAANTPISTLVMVSEMTGNYRLLLPALWVCALAYLIGRRWTIYRSQVRSRLESPAHRERYFVDVLGDLKVGSLLGERPLHTIPRTAPLSEVIPAFATSSQQQFPVIDDRGEMSGILSVNDIRQLLDQDHASGLVIAHDIATRPVVTLSTADELNTALMRFVARDVEELPVVTPEDPKRVVAMVSRRDLIAEYNRRRLERMKLAEQANA